MAWINDPNTIPRLHRKLDKLKQEMKDNQAGMGKASNDANREKYFKTIGQTQHSIDLLKNNIERVEDKNYHLL